MKKIAPILIVIAGILWGSMGIFVRRYREIGLNSMDIVAIRSITTSILMLVFLLFYNRKLFIIRFKDLWCFLGTGLLSILFFNFCYFKAITLTSLSVAAVLLYTAPAIVMILSAVLFKERITKVKIISLFLTFLGCIMVTGIVGSQSVLTVTGILIGLGAGVGYALYSIFSRYALERGYHIYTIIFYTFLITSIGVLPFTHFTEISEHVIKQPSMIVFSVVFGLVSTVLPYLFYTVGLTKVDNGQAAILASIEPVVATLLGIFLYNENLTWTGAGGMLLVLSSIVICNIVKSKKVNSSYKIKKE